MPPTKKNYKPTDKVKVITGRFKDLTGEIISLNENCDKPIKVDLTPCGTWSFNHLEIELTEKHHTEKQTKK